MNGRKLGVIIAVVCISFLSGILVNASVFHWVVSSDSSGGMPKPDYDSGWILVSWETYSQLYFNHSLNTRNLMVVFLRRENLTGYESLGISDIIYQKPLEWTTLPQWDQESEAFTDPYNTIRLTNYPQPIWENHHWIRALIWKIQESPS